MARMTLDQLLEKTSDGDLMDIFNELQSNIVPATGYAHAFCRKVNRMIDSGDMCINPTTYRKVYLPTLVKVINKELARRYVVCVSTGMIEAGMKRFFA